MENLDKLTGFLLESLKETKGFVVEQAPDYIRQMLEYAVFDNQVGLIFGLLLLTIGITLLVIGFRRTADNSHGYRDNSPWYFFGTVITVVGIALSLCTFLTLKKIQIAPKVYLMEKLMQQTKGCSK